MTLDDLLTALRRHRWPALLVAGLVMLVATAAALLPPDRYTARATVIVQPANADDLGPFSAAVQVLLPTLATTVESRSSSLQVRSGLPRRFEGADVELSARPEPGVGLLVVTAESTQQQAVALFANAAVDLLLSQASDDVAGLRLRVLDPARAPTEPSGPPRTAVLAAGLVLATLVGVLTALLAQALARRTELADLITRTTGVRVLGEVPRLRGRARRRLKPETLATTPDARLIEALQQVRIGLDNAGHGQAPRCLAITSLAAAEGKSSVAAALSWSQASAGYPIVLVDADLRRPTQHEHFDVPLTPGLSDAARLPAGELVRRSRYEQTLGIVPSGIPERHPLEVLDAVLQPLLDQLTRDATVIIDTPPLESVAETLRVLVLAQHAVLVVDARRAELRQLDRSIERLQEAGVSVLGVVLNHARVARRRRRDAYYDRPLPLPLPPARESATAAAAVPAAAQPPVPPSVPAEPVVPARAWERGGYAEGTREP